jgi:hypothetical protein
MSRSEATHWRHAGKWPHRHDALLGGDVMERYERRRQAQDRHLLIGSLLLLAVTIAVSYSVLVR